MCTRPVHSLTFHCLSCQLRELLSDGPDAKPIMIIYRVLIFKDTEDSHAGAIGNISTIFVNVSLLYIIYAHIPRKCDFTHNCGDDFVQVLYMLSPILRSVCLSWIIACENVASYSVCIVYKFIC